MGKGPCDFKLTNIKRAVEGARLAGVDVGRIDIATNGTVSITPREQPGIAEDSKPPGKVRRP